MGNYGKIMVGPGAMRTAIQAGLAATRMGTLTFAAFRDLANECGGEQAACEWLLAAATAADKPISVNVPTPEGSTTATIAPASWTPERLQGYVAGHHERLAEEFGEIVATGSQDGGTEG